MTRRRTPYRIIQQHHISYEPEIIVPVFRIEHRIATWLNRIAKSKCSIHFLTLLEEFLKIKIAKRDYLDHKEMIQLHLKNMKVKAERKKQAKLRVRRSK